MQSGNKYHRTIFDLTTDASVTVDVYAVLEAFNVTCPARQHAIKKLLCAGLRGKGDAVQDLTEAGDCIARAVRLEQRKVALKENARPKASTTCVQCKEPITFHPGVGRPWPNRCDRCIEILTNALPPAPEPLPPEGVCNAPCGKCGRLINYALGSEPVPKICGTCAKKPLAPPAKDISKEEDWADD